MTSTADDKPLDFPVFIKLMLSRFWWPAVFIPLIAFGILVFVVSGLPDQHTAIKRLFEQIAPIVLYIAVGIAWLRYGLKRDAFLLWMSVLVSTLLFREFHLIKQATTIAIVVMVTLFVFVWLKYPVFKAYLESRFTVSILAIIVMCYAMTQSLDFDVIKQIKLFGVEQFFSSIEEMLEVFGHVMSLVATILIRPVLSSAEPIAAD